MRSDLFERRRRLMDDWAAYPRGPVSEHRDLTRPRDRAKRPFPGVPEGFQGTYGPYASFLSPGRSPGIRWLTSYYLAERYVTSFFRAQHQL